MSDIPKNPVRSAIAKPDSKGTPTFDWTLTHSSITDIVRLTAGPFDVLPIVFVPGIMGSNLKSTRDGAPVWRLDTGVGGIPWGMLKGFATKGPGPRQQLLHPARCVVDDGGKLPKNGKYSQRAYKELGWGEVGEGSYHQFLLWLDDQLNPSERNPALWHNYYQTEATISAVPKPGDIPKLFPGIKMGMQGQPAGAEKTPFQSIKTDDLIARSKFMMPIHACGYNWLDDNKNAASLLQARILKLIKGYNQGQYRCEQVILVTHSMGGLVARACAQLGGMADKIAGVVHGVMPATGAAVAYRRCKVGMRDEDFGAGLVIGSTGQEVTAVFAQAPGALSLLPSQTYASEWLKIFDNKGQSERSLPQAGQSSYDTIYREQKQWWGLINEAWLSPKEGKPIDWDDYIMNLNAAEAFHQNLIGKYHPMTYVFYGADKKQKSFEKVSWRMKFGIAPDQRQRPSTQTVAGMGHGGLRHEGEPTAYVGGETKVLPTYGMGAPSTYESSYWELHCELQDGAGDGTVPCSSGAAPLTQGSGSIQQQFKLTGFGHEPAYHDKSAQHATLYAVNKLAGVAKKPA